jgi:3-deoxy-D-manno-octulosonic-acid transferase
MLPLYNTALLALRAGAEVLAWWQRADPERRLEWAQRRGFETPGVAPGGVWLHGASVGEARILGAVARSLRGRDGVGELSLSAVTRTGRAQLPEPPVVDATFFAPLDFRTAVRRVLDAVRPSLLVLVETELWPNWLDQARRRDIAAVVINGRLSDERMGRYRRFRSLYLPLLAGLTRVGAQSDDDARRFIELGVPEQAVEITGNVKYDLSVPEADPDLLRSRFGIEEGRPVLVAGSTGAGEETPVLDAFRAARERRPELFLVLAPRHPERADEVEAEVRSCGLRVARLGEGPAAGRGDVLLVDTVGELLGLYRLAWVAFVGGSLVPVGGHNLLEPAALGVPVLFGPHTHHFAEPAAELERRGGGRCVADADELATWTSRLLDDSERRGAMGRAALDVVRSNRGALARSVALVLSALGGSASVPR